MTKRTADRTFSFDRWNDPGMKEGITCPTRFLLEVFKA